MRVFDNANYPFHSWRRRAYMVFAALVLLDLVGIIRNIVSDRPWPAYGVAFTGGTRVQVEFNQPVEAEAVRSAAAAGRYDDWEIAGFGSPTDFVIRMGEFEQ